MIFDTDILIWIQRGNKAAALLVNEASERYISLHSLLELLQLAPSKTHQRLAKEFLADLNFTVLPLSEGVGHRALVYSEEFGLSGGLRAGDALIAATAIENNLPLVSSNFKHFKSIKELQLIRFSPRVMG